MKKTILFISFSVLLIFCISSCDIDDVDDVDDVDWNNEYIKLAYDSNYKYPTGFFQDEAIVDPEYCSPNAPGYRSFKYLNRKDINSNDETIPLYTSSKEISKEWFNIFSLNSKWEWNDNFVLEKENKNEKFFEYIVVDKNFSYSSLTRLVRIHHEDYFIPQNRIDPEPHDKQHEVYDIGIYNGEFSLVKVKELIEYLWYLKIYQTANYKVKKTEISEDDEKVEFQIQYLFIIRGDWDMRDVVYVYNSKYSLNKETRVLQFIERNLIDLVYGKMNYINWY